jgi:putative tricarboxylic transport membrane protein
MTGFGVLGYLMRKGGFPSAPMIMAMILSPMLERAMRQSLLLSGGNLIIFIQEPISAGLLCVAAFMGLTPFFQRLWKQFRFNPDEN